VNNQGENVIFFLRRSKCDVDCSSGYINYAASLLSIAALLFEDYI